MNLRHLKTLLNVKDQVLVMNVIFFSISEYKILYFFDNCLWFRYSWYCSIAIFSGAKGYSLCSLSRCNSTGCSKSTTKNHPMPSSSFQEKALLWSNYLQIHQSLIQSLKLEETVAFLVHTNWFCQTFVQKDFCVKKSCIPAIAR